MRGATGDRSQVVSVAPGLRPIIRAEKHTDFRNRLRLRLRAVRASRSLWDRSPASARAPAFAYEPGHSPGEFQVELLGCLLLVLRLRQPTTQQRTTWGGLGGLLGKARARLSPLPIRAQAAGVGDERAELSRRGAGDRHRVVGEHPGKVLQDDAADTAGVRQQPGDAAEIVGDDGDVCGDARQVGGAADGDAESRGGQAGASLIPSPTIASGSRSARTSATLSSGGRPGA